MYKRVKQIAIQLFDKICNIHYIYISAIYVRYNEM